MTGVQTCALPILFFDIFDFRMYQLFLLHNFKEEGVEGMSYHEYSKREFIKRTREMGIDIDSVMP